MSSAERLLARMRQTAAGWGQDDLDALFRGFGFQAREGKHTVYRHPKYPQLRATVPRHGSLAKGYVRYAVKLIDTLKSLEEGGDE